MCLNEAQTCHLHTLVSERSLLTAARLRHTNESQLPLISPSRSSELLLREQEERLKTARRHLQSTNHVMEHMPVPVSQATTIDQTFSTARAANEAPRSDRALLHLQRSQLVWKHRWTDVPNRPLRRLPALRHSGKC